MLGSMDVDGDVSVTVLGLTDAKTLEEIQGHAMVVEEDDEGVGTAEDKVPVKSSNKEVRQAMEAVPTYLLLTENWEIEAIATKISSAVQSELTRFSKQMTIKNFSRKLRYSKAAYMCSIIYLISARCIESDKFVQHSLF